LANSTIALLNSDSNLAIDYNRKILAIDTKLLMINTFILQDILEKYLIKEDYRNNNSLIIPNTTLQDKVIYPQ